MGKPGCPTPPPAGRRGRSPCAGGVGKPGFPTPLGQVVRRASPQRGEVGRGAVPRAAPYVQRIAISPTASSAYRVACSIFISRRAWKNAQDVTPYPRAQPLTTCGTMKWMPGHSAPFSLPGGGGEGKPAYPNAITPVGAHRFCLPVPPRCGEARGSLPQRGRVREGAGQEEPLLAMPPSRTLVVQGERGGRARRYATPERDTMGCAPKPCQPGRWRTLHQCKNWTPNSMNCANGWP